MQKLPPDEKRSVRRLAYFTAEEARRVDEYANKQEISASTALRNGVFKLLGVQKSK